MEGRINTPSAKPAGINNQMRRRMDAEITNQITPEIPTENKVIWGHIDIMVEAVRSLSRSEQVY